MRSTHTVFAMFGESKQILPYAAKPRLIGAKILCWILWILWIRFRTLCEILYVILWLLVQVAAADPRTAAACAVGISVACRIQLVEQHQEDDTQVVGRSLILGHANCLVEVLLHRSDGCDALEAAAVACPKDTGGYEADCVGVHHANLDEDQYTLQAEPAQQVPLPNPRRRLRLRLRWQMAVPLSSQATAADK